MEGRIWFEGNPWPDGHAIKELEFRLLLDEAGVGLLLNLETDDYYAEDPSYFDEEFEEEHISKSDWESKIVWGNYHSCHLSNIEWGIDPETITRLNTPFGPDDLNFLSFEIDPVPFGKESPKDYEEHDFNIYLLGHDAVASHDMKIERQQNGLFTIQWIGLIAQAYVGDHHFKHRFRAEAKDVPFLRFHIENKKPDVDWPKPVPPTEKDRRDRAFNLAGQYLKDFDRLSFESGKGWDGDALFWPDQ
jgi:hypothetical protein